ncbi:hypothetical protein JKP88DRAFT_326581 [Tribonema minus]|uniref:Uncharacterized protein n=1 Tax=Tribonema minus TaxID=303371 RepID=A0A836CBE9_9STRA|nr:hypothetical protein JKP88DRAFT_326581 [Tribonema minus]
MWGNRLVSVTTTVMALASECSAGLFTLSQQEVPAADLAALPATTIAGSAKLAMPNCADISGSTSSLKIKIGDCEQWVPHLDYFDTIGDRKVWLGSIPDQLPSSVKIVCPVSPAPDAVKAFLLEMEVPCEMPGGDPSACAECVPAARCSMSLRQNLHDHGQQNSTRRGRCVSEEVCAPTPRVRGGRPLGTYPMDQNRWEHERGCSVPYRDGARVASIRCGPLREPYVIRKCRYESLTS